MPQKNQKIPQKLFTQKSKEADCKGLKHSLLVNNNTFCCTYSKNIKYNKKVLKNNLN
uniref:Candidate secreted effector n=1 Tax=Meloidogyne incognita TaxID=6306 RepID=A0A914MX32_MELIC